MGSAGSACADAIAAMLRHPDDALVTLRRLI